MIYFVNLLKAGIVFLLWVVVYSFLGDIFWTADILSHFYLQYLLIAALITLLLALFRSTFTVVWIFIIISLSFIIFPISLPSQESDVTNVDYYFMNTLVINNDTDSIINDIAEKKPKTLALVEANEKIVNEIKKRSNYKYSIYKKKWTFSIAVFSMYKIKNPQIIEIKGIPFFRWEINERKIYVLHPISPIKKDRYELQKEYFEKISKDLKVLKDTTFILMWDFNSTSYSRVFQTYFWKYNYKTIYSWATDKPYTIPIDYIISNKKIEVYPWKKLSSDHKPIYAKETTD